ncbi:hypothetical protein GH810_12705 [Acetobacterium paludosum]|uniref:BIG2 domain-containing protein n=1 Tax=Acetobacterium paludosum TaxID=52693 RepID=A0A923KQI3_9FIRM|nr:hypothetical protein [Acetobacterium paludosum]MBC3889174.1 hypothetical protein [Acetobacterium paludosum]
MKKITVSILSSMLMFSMIFSTSAFAAADETQTSAVASGILTNGVATEATSNMGVQYRAHIQDVGDYPTDGTWVIGPTQIGTPGLSRRIEGVELQLTGDIPAGAKIVYNLHVQDYGWLGNIDDPTTWQEGPNFAGTRAERKRIEAIQIELLYADGTKLDGYSVQYSGHVENIGDVAAVADGQKLGTVGASQRLECLKVQIVQTTSLAAYNTALAAVKEADYTTASWSAYQKVVTANVVSLANTQAKVDVATAAITAAQKDLVKLSNLTAYNKATAAITEDQVKSGWTAYKAVLDANVVTNQNTQKAVDDATAKIVAAQKSLDLYAEMTEFNKAINLYVTYGADAANAPYTEATWNTYTTQCELYGTLKDDVWVYDVISKNSTQATVDAATTYINSAVAKLVKTTDLTAFNAAKMIKITDGPYTTASFDTYSKDPVVVYLNGLTSNALKSSTQAVVDSYTDTIISLQKKILVLGSDISKYNEALALVKQADYTTVSWSTYQTVVSTNTVTANNAQAVVDAATATVLTAQNNLIYSAAYVVAKGNINSASFEVQSVNDNILTRAKELMTANELDTSKYLITFTRVDTTGTAVINPTTGLITNVGTGTATVTFTITPVDGSAAATTANVVLVLS